jgi:signal peptidase I
MEHRSTPSRRGGTRSLLELPFLVIAALSLALLLKGTTAQAFSIPSESMYPQLHIGDRVIVSRVSYRLHDPRRGDIVVFPSPAVHARAEATLPHVWHGALETIGLRKPGDEELIKRVIGLPGETIQAKGGHVLIDGRVLHEPYLPPSVLTTSFPPVHIPAGRVFVMGDNRGNSHDSRYADIGTIDEDTIVGRAIARIWPLDRTAFL